jgi:hypothetical protein
MDAVKHAAKVGPCIRHTTMCSFRSVSLGACPLGFHSFPTVGIELSEQMNSTL